MPWWGTRRWISGWESAMPSRSRSVTASSVGAALEELEPRGRIEEEVLGFDGGARGGVHVQLVVDAASLAAHEGT